MPEPEKRKANFTKEINTISALRDEPPGEILKTRPLPRQIVLQTPTIPPPGSPRTVGKKRERSTSTSPISSPRSIRARKDPQDEIIAYSNTDEPSLTLSSLVPIANKKKRKRKRKEKEM